MIFCKEDKFLLVKIFKSYLKDFDIYDNDKIIELLKIIFIKVKNKYDLSGLFRCDIYVNEDYGIIIEIINLECYIGECDIKVNVHLDSIFLMEIISYEILEFEDVYYYDNKFYSKFNSSVDRKIIYKNVDDIINNGIKIC